MTTLINRALILLFAASLPLVPLAAAEKNPQPEEKPKKESTKKTIQDGEEKTKKPVIFKPSEELSEDYSVPFPTDI